MSREQKPRSMKSEIIINELRMDIVTQKYCEGDKLSENEIAVRFNSSRGSVRSSLQALESEGLIRILPNGRKVVIGFTLQNANDMYDLRWMIENRALEIVFEKRSSYLMPLLSVLRVVEQINEQEKQQADWYAIDISFHRALVQTAENLPLFKAWETNSSIMYALMQLNTTKGYRDMYIQEFYAKHRALFDLIVSNNTDCFALLREHITDARDISVDVLTKYAK